MKTLSRLLKELVTHGRRTDLAGEHRLGDAGQIALFLLFMALWVSDLFQGYSNFLNGLIPAMIRLPAGSLLLAISVYLAFAGLRLVFVGKAPSGGVIRKGPFGLVRHPVYLSEIIYYLGLLFINLSLAAAAVMVVAVIFLHYISRYEEKLMLAKFGGEYRRYLREVPMWLPRLFRKRPAP
ncbi:MAG: isoprenylcysteine carboxylmethyltransferase family protein [Chloroflexota bacterium]